MSLRALSTLSPAQFSYKFTGDPCDLNTTSVVKEITTSRLRLIEASVLFGLWELGSLFFQNGFEQESC